MKSDAEEEALYRTDVVSVKADGTGRRVEATGAGLPAPAGGSVVVVRSRVNDPQLPEGHVSIERISSDGHSATILESDAFQGRAIVAMVADNRRIAFVESDDSGPASLVIVDTIERWALRVQASTDTYPTMSMCGAVLAFNMASGDGASSGEQYFLDANGEDLAAIQVEGLYPGTLCAGDIATWKHLGKESNARAQATVSRLMGGTGTP